jgi:uncharacterized tellurite resistance protein B-like protein
MLNTLRDLIDSIAATVPDAAADAGEHQLQLAVAVLLVEVMRADAQFSDTERQAVLGALRDKFPLAPDECERLAELAVSTAREATDYHAFTSRLNERFSMEQKLRMVEHLWRVAYADGTLSAHEQHVMWRLADLLHVPHGAYIHAKMRAREAAGG